MIGLNPAFHYGINWKYTFEELYENCHHPTIGISSHTALITGGNSGIGYQTARALAKCGVDVTLACRNESKCLVAADKIRNEAREYLKQNGDSNAINVSIMTVDMSSLKSVQQFSQEFLKKNQNGALDMLYLNAGIGVINKPGEELKLSEDGIELTFATNYVGHHLMYRLLEPLLLKSKMARVIQVSSCISFDTFGDKVATSLDTLNGPARKPYSHKHYGQSKLAQILWTKYLTKRLSEANINNIYANASHPGSVDTGIWMKNAIVIPSFVLDYLRKYTMWTEEDGALTQLYLGVATKELMEKDIRGKYFHPQAQEVVNPLSLDEKLQKDVWDFSEELVSDFL